MTYSFSADLTDAGDYVRFHTGDTVSPGYMSDELITSMIAVEGSNNAAVIAGIRYIMSFLARPDFTADWLSVSNAAARAGYKELLGEKQREFGIPALSISTVHVYRADSDADEAPEFD